MTDDDRHRFFDFEDNDALESKKGIAGDPLDKGVTEALNKEQPVSDGVNALDGGVTGVGDVAEEKTLSVGSLFASRYEILSEGIQGGMGVVYKVKDTRLYGETIALKVIHPRFLNSEQALKRFRQEVVICRKLLHPNIVRVHNLDVYGGLEYFTMEWVEGKSLREVLNERKREGKPFSLEETISLFSQLSSALSYAHAYTVHRDIKPENILIRATPSGMEVKLTDFGIAKMLTPSEVSLKSGLMGTPYYMAPEQKSEAGKVDQRADIYALGILLFELLTLENVIGPYGPSEINAKLPPAIDKIFSKAAALKPKDRYFNIESFLLDLEKITVPESKSEGTKRVLEPQLYVDGIRTGTVRARKIFQPKVLFMITAFVLTGLLGLIYKGVFEKKPEKAHMVDIKEIREPVKLEKYIFSEDVISACFSPDGKYIISSDKEGHIRLRELNTGMQISNFKHEAGNQACFSKDGKYIYSLSSHSVAIMDANTGNTIRTFNARSHDLSSAGFGVPVCIDKFIDVTPDCKYVLSMTWTKEYIAYYAARMRASIRGQLNPSDTWENPQKYLTVLDVASGKVAMARISNVKYGTGKLAPSIQSAYEKIGKYYTGKEVMSFRSAYKYKIFSIAFSSDLRRMAVMGGDSTNGFFEPGVKVIDFATGKILSTMEKIYDYAHEEKFKGILDKYAVAMSDDGTLYASVASNKTIRMKSLYTSTEKIFAGHNSFVLSVAFSRDGNYLASGGKDGIIKVWDVKSGKEIRTLTGHSADTQFVAFSPSGEYILSGSKDKTIRVWPAPK
jgi:serine/threonine protein kinase